MKWLWATISLIIPLTVSGQVDSLPELKNVLDWEGIVLPTNWVLSYKYADPQRRPKRNETVVKDLADYSRTDHVGRMVIENRKSLLTLFGKLGLIGDDLGEFLYDSARVPVSFCKSDSSLVLLVVGAGSPTIFNTLRTTARERAARIIETKLLSTLEDICEAAKKANAPLFGIILVYGSKDFSDNLSTEGEVVALITRTDLYDKFARSEITSDRLIDDSRIYQRDRSGSRMGLIKVSLQ